ncbi:nucleoside triphosphate pyrophosphohydrolase [Niallia sp. FSL W8-0635]|uniref:nucleoside triphosphate pyrophosphohydrolase n=1 Tax=Niallia sp. FSL W8-0635 TaxID=2975337 RepID=UPI000C762ECF
MPVHNKLVRDKIPQIITSTGKKYTTKILSDSEYIHELRMKSLEELKEYLEAPNRESALEELADVLEILHALANYHQSSFKEIDQIRKQKAEDRGEFKERIYLVEVED